jgi:predicted TIM-barrel fold metal-dependent hydrolase
MTDPIRVDVHMHLYKTKDVGEWWKRGYEIWEYGPKDDVHFSSYSGTVEDAIEAMSTAGFDHGIGLNLFAVELSRREAISRIPDEFEGEERERAVAEIDATLGKRYRESNRWLCDALAPFPQFTPFVAADPWVLPPELNAAHLREMADAGARGIKIHPAAQAFAPSDPRMSVVFETCRDLGLAVLSHTGSSNGEAFAEPAAFADMLQRFPDLTVVLAHLGGGAWHQTAELARAFPRVSFDLCEVIDWTGAPNAPTDEQLAALIRDVGVDRVVFGTDFPWYDLDHTLKRVMELPILSSEEKEKILGANAARILGLPV